MTPGISLRLALVLAVASCGDPQVQRDGGRDAGDAGPDGGSDAGADGGRDAGRDAVVPPAEWVRVPGLPEACDVEVALEPDSAMEPFEFEACPGIARCRQLVADFPEHPRGVRFQVQEYATYVDSERILFGYYRPVLIGRRDLNYQAIATGEGRHLAAVRAPPVVRTGVEWCTVDDVSPARDSYAFTVTHRTPAGAIVSYVLRAPYLAPADLQPLWQGDGPTVTASVGWIEVSDSIVGMFTSVPIEVHRVDAASVTTTLCPAEPGAPYCRLDDVVGSSVLSSHDQGGWWVAIADAGDSRFRPLIDAPDAEDAIAQSDGVDLVWMRGFDPEWGRPTRFELWASPYAEQPEDLVPRRIAPINATGFNPAIGVGNGRAWTGERGDMAGQPSYIAIHDLESAERRTVRFREGESWGQQGPILGRDEVAIPIHPAPPGEYLETRTVRFIEYDALPIEPAPE